MNNETRLKTLDPQLENRVRGVSKAQLFELKKRICAEAIKQSGCAREVSALLTNAESQPNYADDVLSDLAARREHMDGLYFDLSESGRENEAVRAFSKARVLGAVYFAISGKEAFHAIECIYEAAMAVVDVTTVLSVASREIERLSC